MPDKNVLLMETLRKALLEIVDAIERWLGIDPRTAEIRKERR